MRLTITQPALAALIERGGAAAAAKNSPIPILNMVRLTAIDGELALASSDQDRFAEAIARADVAEEGALCVASAAFKTLIGKHPKSGTINLQVEDGRLLVTCGRSKVKLPTLPAANFPTWAEFKPEASFALDGKEFSRAFSRVRFAASSDDVKYYLQGVHLDETVDEKGVANLHFVATDGHRLAVSGLAMPAPTSCPKVTVPAEAVDAALAVFKDAARIDIEVSAKAISFAADSLRLSSRLIDGTYPDYARFIPDRGGAVLAFKRADFVDCLDRATVFIGEGALSSIVARPDVGSLRLESRNHNGGEADEELSATIDDGFKPFGFNARYAADFLRTLNVGALTIEQNDPNGPHLVLSEDAPDFLGVLMPMRVAG